jgi:hypothetical protein
MTTNPKPVSAEERYRSSARVIEGEAGYVTAFYEIVDMLGIPAQPASPKHVWETQMRPLLARALANQEKQP